MTLAARSSYRWVNKVDLSIISRIGILILRNIYVIYSFLSVFSLQLFLDIRRTDSRSYEFCLGDINQIQRLRLVKRPPSFPRPLSLVII